MGNETWKNREYIPQDSECLESKCFPFYPALSLQRKDDSWTLCSLYRLLDSPFQGFSPGVQTLHMQVSLHGSHPALGILLFFIHTVHPFYSAAESGASQCSGSQPSRWVKAIQVEHSHPGGSQPSRWDLAIQVG